MMREGLLWFDDDPERELREKVARAAARYKRKFGRAPNRCYVNERALDDGDLQVGVIKVMSMPNILPHHFWLGIDDNKEAIKEA